MKKERIARHGDGTENECQDDKSLSTLNGRLQRNMNLHVTKCSNIFVSVGDSTFATVFSRLGEPSSDCQHLPAAGRGDL